MENRKLKAFTLIELLMVIAIISLLASILLPSLNRAKELARRVVCASNMKSCGLATTLYAKDSGGKILVYTWDGKEEIVWHEALTMSYYLDKDTDAKALLCPSHAPKVYGSKYDTLGGRRHNDTPKYCRIYLRTLGTNHNWGYLNSHRVKDTSNYFHLADAVFKPGHSHYPNQCYCFAFDSRTTGIHMRHSGMTNLWFVDGHVKACGEDELVEAILTELPSDTRIMVVEDDDYEVPLNP